VKEEKILINKIHKRDDYFCQYCGRDGLDSLDSWHELTVDHFIPIGKGGTSEEKNLVTCCGYCNAIKGNRIFDSLDQAKEYILKRRMELEKEYQKVRKTIRKL